MSDKPYYHEPNNTIHLRVWALGQMVWGAFLAGAALLLLAGALGAIYGVSLLLPEESKQAPAPMGSIEIVLPVETA